MRIGPGFAAAIAVTAALAQPPERRAAEMEPLLAKIATYQYGQSREALAQLSRLVEGSAGSPALKEAESRLVRFLESEATAAAKESVFKELSLIATEASVPVLSGMLTGESTSEMARYALARIPGAAADEALRKGLGASSGKVRIGIINSLGQRRDAKATPALEALIHSEQATAEAAIFALGSIGDRGALEGLAKAMRGSSGEMRQRAAEAYVRCADNLAAQGDRSGALGAYRELNTPEQPEMVRIAALSGLARVEGKGSVGTLTAAAEAKSGPRVQDAAIRLLAGIPGQDVTDALARQYGKLPAAGQARLATVLAERGDPAARPLLITAAKAGDREVRIAGLTGLGKLGDESSVAVLAEAAASTQARERSAARESLAALKGASVDAAIVRGIEASSGKVKIEYILAADERRSPEAAGALMAAARDREAETRRAALRALRNAAGPEQAGDLVELLKAGDAAEREETVAALAGALKRSPAAQTGMAIAAYRKAAGMEQRLALLEALGQSSNAEALPLLRESLRESNAEIARGAILSLSSWGDAAPMPDLLAAARNRQEPALQILSLRGYLKLLAMPSKRSNPDSARMVGEAMVLAREPAEKRTALALLASYPCEEALRLAERSVADDAVAAEAKASVEKIRRALRVR